MRPKGFFMDIECAAFLVVFTEDRSSRGETGIGRPSLSNILQCVRRVQRKDTWRALVINHRCPHQCTCKRKGKGKGTGDVIGERERRMNVEVKLN